MLGIPGRQEEARAGEASGQGPPQCYCSCMHYWGPSVPQLRELQEGGDYLWISAPDREFVLR